MDHLTRLLIRAKKAVNGPGACYAIGFVEYDQEAEKYIAVPKLWDGVAGSANSVEYAEPPGWTAAHETQEKALEALNALFSYMGIDERDSVILTMDYGLED